MFAAWVMACLENLGIRSADHLDLVTGTSASGIIALKRGAQLRPTEIEAEH